MRKVHVMKYALRIRYFRILLIALVLPALFVGSCLYYVIFTILALSLGIPDAIAAHLLPVMHQVDMMLLIGLPIIILFLAVWGFILANRLVGPIARIDREIEGIIAEKNFSKRIKVREKDDLKLIVDKINILLDQIEKPK